MLPTQEMAFMIVDLIEVKRALDRTANMFIRAEIKKRTPFVSQIGVIPQHEGSNASYETVDRQVQEIDYQLTLSKLIELTEKQMGRLSHYMFSTVPTAFGKLGQLRSSFPQFP
jgi:hypothetical protein